MHSRMRKKFIIAYYDKTNCGPLRLEENPRKHTANQRKTTFLHYIVTLAAIHHIVPTRLQTICIHFVLYKASQLKNKKWHRGGESLPLFLFCLKELWFFIITICTCINSVRKVLGNQITFTPSIKVIPFSKYLSFHLGVVLVHANWANLIL